MSDSVEQLVKPAWKKPLETIRFEVEAVPAILMLPAKVEVPVLVMTRLPPKVEVAVEVAMMLPMMAGPCKVVEAKVVSV